MTGTSGHDILEHMFEGGRIEEPVFTVPDASCRPAAAGPRTPVSSGHAAVPPSPDVAELLARLGRVAAVNPVDLPPEQALADCTALLALQAQLTPVLMRRLADVDTRGLHQLADSPTTTSWVRAQGSPVSDDVVTTAKRIGRFPTLDDAVRDGSVSVADAAKVSTALSRLRRHVDRPDGRIDGMDGDAAVTAVVTDGVLSLVGQAMGGVADDDPRTVELAAQLSEVSCWPTSQLARIEAGLVLLAAHLPAGALRAALAELVDALLPNELERKARQAEDDRRLLLRPHDDRPGGHLCADLDAETFELAHTALTAAAENDPDRPLDTEAWARLREQGWELGDPVPAELDGPCTAPRSKAQRMHDALRLALRALLDSGGLGSRGKAAPHINVTTDLDTLNQQPGARPSVGGSGQRLPLSLVTSWWCDAYVTRFVLGLGHRVLEMSHTERTLKAHERALKRVETGGHCQGAGCTRGPGCRLIPHHVYAFAQHGRTSIVETVMLCELSHALLHKGATITLKDGRRLNASGWVA